jgi:hypothetical protein
MAGNQIDGNVDLEGVDRHLHPIAFGAENPSTPAGIKIIGEVSDISDRLHRERRIDEDVIVLASVLSEPAWNATRKHDQRLPKLPHLDTMVTEAHVRGRAQIPVSPGNAFLLSRAGCLQYNNPQAASRLSVQPTENSPQAFHYEHTE